MAQTVLGSLDEVRAAVGRRLGTGDWLEITRDGLDRFAAGSDEPACVVESLSRWLA
jgi:hypothetical protein